MKVLLLGHTGFVGSNVAEVLHEAAIEFAAASKSTGLDLRNTNDTTDFLSQVQPDFIINCAAHVGSLNYVTEQAADVIRDNTQMILGMYEGIAKACPAAMLINPIANCAYPATSNVFIEDEWWNGPLHRSVLAYGSSRRLLWTVGESYQMQHDIKSIYLLVPNMYGPHDSTDPNKAHALNALISKFVKAEKEQLAEIKIWGTGIAIREWLYAKDFARIVLKVLKEPKMIGLAEPLNIAQNFGLSVRELVEIISGTFQFKGRITWEPNKPDGAPKKVMDDRRFRKVFANFVFTDFTEGIKMTKEYYQSKYPF